MPTPAPFTLTSPAFSPGGQIPVRFSCDGEDVSPPLEWAGAPPGTATLALVVDDPDANGFVHWVLFGLTGAASGRLREGISTSPEAPPQGTNDFRRIGWGGPCPPSGTHRYRFTFYALDAPVALTGGPRATELRRAVEGHVLAQARLEASYRRR